jgi:hypothetical protein
LNFFAYSQVIFIEYHLGLRVWWAAYPVLQNRGGDDGSGANIGHFPPFAITSEGLADFYFCSRFYVPSTITLIRSSILASPTCNRATSARSCLSSSSLISRAFLHDLATKFDAFIADESRCSCDQFGDFMLTFAAERAIASAGLSRTDLIAVGLDQVTHDGWQLATEIIERFAFGMDAGQVAGFDKPH